MKLTVYVRNAHHPEESRFDGDTIIDGQTVALTYDALPSMFKADCEKAARKLFGEAVTLEYLRPMDPGYRMPA